MKSAAAGKQEVPTLEENTLYQNLCILGIAPPPRGEGVDLNRTSFRRTNNKGVEYVLYRLHYIIEGKPRTTKVCHLCCAVAPGPLLPQNTRA